MHWCIGIPDDLGVSLAINTAATPIHLLDSTSDFRRGNLLLLERHGRFAD